MTQNHDQINYLNFMRKYVNRNLNLVADRYTFTNDEFWLLSSNHSFYTLNWQLPFTNGTTFLSNRNFPLGDLLSGGNRAR